MTLEELINSCDVVKVKKGIYETKPLFIKTSKKIIFEKGVVIKPILSDDYDLIETRVAGINMKWYPAILNILDTADVTIKGEALIDACGEYFWEKYWGKDKNGGMRKEYDEKGLRWACDYDCKRLRTILVQNSKNVNLSDFTIYRSGFWNVHILYSHDVLIKNIKIKTPNQESPSTDGIDIDSSYNVIVDKCKIDCFDDSICIKSGRDYDGIKTNIASHDIEIKNCVLNKGFGITIGSELSGGIYNINIHDNKFINTDCGFRIKSSEMRKGYVKNINVYNLKLKNVKYVFNFDLDWNKGYNNIKVDPSLEIGEELKKMLKIVPSSIKNTEVDGINIYNIKSFISKNYNGVSRLFNIKGFDDVKMKNIRLKNIKSYSLEYGIIKNADVFISSSNIKYKVLIDDINNEFDNR